MSLMFLPLRLIPLPVQCVVLSTVLELVFSRDATLKPLLKALHGKIFRVYVNDMSSVIYMGFSQGIVWVHPNHNGEADVRIEASTSAFARLCFAKEDPDDLVFQQVLKIAGDSEAMLRFKTLLAEVDLDWEKELRANFGEFFGSRVARAAKALIAAENKVAESSRNFVADVFIAVETPNAERLQAWQAGVETCSHHVSRMKGRVTRIEHRLADEQNHS